MPAALSTIVAVTVGHAAPLLAHMQPALTGSGGGGGGGGAPASSGGGGGAAPGAGGPGGMMNLLMIFGVLGFMYFFVLRPQNKQRQEQEKLQKGLQKGDQVVTTSGIIGTVNAVEDRFVELKLADKVFVKFERNAVIGQWDPNPKTDEKGASKEAAAEKK